MSVAGGTVSGLTGRSSPGQRAGAVPGRDDVYIQVWQRPDGIYQLEHRAGSPSEHYQTLTVSSGKVFTAFDAWRRGEVGWDTPFTWRLIDAVVE